jgi:hypothetical protein
MVLWVYVLVPVGRTGLGKRPTRQLMVCLFEDLGLQ